MMRPWKYERVCAAESEVEDEGVDSTSTGEEIAQNSQLWVSEWCDVEDDESDSLCLPSTYENQIIVH